MTHKEDIKRIKETINNRKVIKWFNYFADYIEKSKPNIYNEACNFADDTEKNK
tara:strand:+ start:1065 stop:1223 length:159 start_codon:yes stop_codon:yes gene_type:complete